MPTAFQREYLIQLPLPLAQLYNRAHNAKDPRSRHDHAYYLFEALVKLLAAPLVAAYLQEIRQGGKRVDVLDWRLHKLALPSLGDWVDIVRELARHFGTQAETPGHPLAHLWGQLTQVHRDTPGLVRLYQRIKQGPDGAPAGDRSCSILQVLEKLVQYRNGVFGHGAVRFEAFYAQDMGPLLFPALNELLATAVLTPIGPSGSRLIYLQDVRAVSEDAMELSFRDLVGLQGELGAPMRVGREEARDLIPHCVAVLWPDHPLPLRLDPLLRYRDTDLDAEVLFLNRDHKASQVEYLSYTTGCTERDATMERAMTRLLSLLTAQPITAERLAELEAERLATTPPEDLAPDPAPAPAISLGDYELLAEIGRGGMGVVYLARQRSLGRLVALKMLPEALARDAVALARFQREMRALASCDHPNIMKVLTHGELPDGRLYYTMEYVPGADLEQIWQELATENGTAAATRLGSITLARAVHTASGKHRQATAARYQSGAPVGTSFASGSSGVSTGPRPAAAGKSEPSLPPLPVPPLPPLPVGTPETGSYVRGIVMLMRDVAFALQAVHDQGILHRDVKPANLMLTPDGTRIVLMDFGLAKGQDTTLAASKQGGLLGTLRYAAPEQLAYPRVDLSWATDVYGLGVTLWELLTRHRLFADAEDEKQLAALMHDADVPSIRTVDPSLDRDLEAIVARATARRVSERIPTAGQLAVYLQQYLDGQPLPFLQPTLREKGRRWLRRHRKALAAGCAGLVLLSAAAAGAWYWDAYVRAHVDYYAEVITRWGLPEGVGRLSTAQMRQRNASLALYKHGRRGPVHEVRLVNSRGTYPPFGMSSPDMTLGLLNPLYEDEDDVIEGLGVSRIVFERDARGQMLNQIAYNRADRRLYTLHYVHPTMAEYKDEGITRVKRESGIALLKFVRPASGPETGLDQEVRYFDSTGTPQPARSGAYGFRHRFEARGLPVEEIYLGADGQPAVKKTGIATATLTYNTLGKVTQIAYFGREGQAVLNKQGMVGMQFTYDSIGNLQERVAIGIDGQLVTIRQMGAAGVRYRYDAHGNSSEVTFLDPSRQPVRGRQGFARITRVWDESGGCLETYFGPDGHPIVAEGRWVTGRQRWDARGYGVEAAFFDEYMRPIRHASGCAKQRLTHDAHGNLSEVLCLDEENHPLRSTEGSAKFTRVHDNHGNILEERYFGTTGQSERYDEPYVTRRWKYNAQGKEVEEAYFDAAGQLVANKDGYARVTYTYDQQGRLIETAFFDAQQQPTARQGGYAKIVRTYDAYDRLSAETLYDPQGQPTRNEDGYVSTRFAYDARGYRIAHEYFDADNHPTLHRDGYAKVLKQYNDIGQLVEQVYVGLDGAFVPDQEDGSAKVRWTYNGRGQVEKTSYFDAQDRLVPLVYGYATIHSTYDALGRATAPKFFDAHGEPVVTRVVLKKMRPNRIGAQRGFQVGDIILQYDGEEIYDYHTLTELGRMKTERERTFHLLRQGQEVRLKVPPGRLTGLTWVTRVPPAGPETSP